MLAGDRARRVPGWSWLSTLGYDAVCLLTRIAARIFWRVRIEGRERIPATGALIFACNHQSYADPVLDAMATHDRPTTSVARAELFRFAPFGLLIRLLGAVPIRQDAGDLGAIRLVLGELTAGRCVLIYPEGGRTPDGTVQPFQRGFALLVRRARVPVVPMAIAGAFEAWPRTRKLPRPGGRIAVVVGEAIAPDRLAAEADGGVALVEAAVTALLARATTIRCPASPR